MKLIDKVYCSKYVIWVYKSGKEKIYKIFENDVLLDSCVYHSKKNYHSVCRKIFSRILPVWKQLQFNF